MKIAYVTDLRLNDHSAPSIHVDVVCRHFALRGHSVELYAPQTSAFMAPQSYRIAYIPSPQRFLSLVYQPRLFARLFHDVRMNRPDILFIRHSHLLLVPTLIGMLFGIPRILEVNNVLEQDARHLNQTALSCVLLTTRIFSFIEWINTRYASVIISVSDGIKDYLVSTYGTVEKKVHVMPNAVDTTEFAPRVLKQVREELAMDTDALCVGYLGSLHTWQGVTDILEAARIVHLTRPGIRFLMVGSGEEEKEVHRLKEAYALSGILELVPAVAHSNAPVYINAFDIAISYPKKLRARTTSPFKVYEYLACGTPVISSDIEGMREEFGDALVYAEPESPESLAHKIIELADDEEYRRRLGKNARAFVEKGHSWHAVVSGIEDICRPFVRSI